MLLMVHSYKGHARFTGLAFPWRNFKLQKIVRAPAAGKSEYPRPTPPIVRAPAEAKSQNTPSVTNDRSCIRLSTLVDYA